jgi:putative FmdB family regulatory protein
MPLYEYLCKKCGHRFEEIKKFSDKQPTKCPECGGLLEQVISAPAVQFKGSGWYVTDYAKKGSGSVGTSSPSSSSSSNSSEGDGGGKETKDSKESKDSRDSKESKESNKDDKPKSESSRKRQKKD